MTTIENFTLKDEIRAYWAERSATFDQSPGHGMRSDDEIEAWAALFARHFRGADVKNVLELASGTGQITAVLLSMGLSVTGLDLCEEMIEIASNKHRDLANRVKFYLGDAENTMMVDEQFDAVCTRHLVWTLLDPEAALRDWKRTLKPGGVLVVVDGDWVTVPQRWDARVKRAIINFWNKLDGTQPLYDKDAHASIIKRVYFNEGLRIERISQMLRDAGFVDVQHNSLESIWTQQRKHMSLKERLSLGIWYGHYFMVSARKP